MSVAYFDTLAFSKKLRGQFTPEQAETLAEAFVAGVNEQLVTKSDLTEFELRLEARFSQIDSKFSQMDSKFSQVDGRFSQLEGKLDAKYSALETKIAETANRMLVWTVGSIFSSAALIVALEKLLP